ncbi:hypothetical protein [Nocardia brasiliensis]|uniref:hypothetical protein n=1 Tax=Nocardia brasiliensis TaxID=37326 RepID=UPI00245882B2|nr:hypothetical protein [Nocardia brasiliensis]
MSHPSLPPEVEQATVFTAGTPVVIALPRFRQLLTAPDGALVDADPWTSVILASGARPMLVTIRRFRTASI